MMRIGVNTWYQKEPNGESSATTSADGLVTLYSHPAYIDMHDLLDSIINFLY